MFIYISNFVWKIVAGIDIMRWAVATSDCFWFWLKHQIYTHVGLNILLNTSPEFYHNHDFFLFWALCGLGSCTVCLPQMAFFYLIYLIFSSISALLTITAAAAPLVRWFVMLATKSPWISCPAHLGPSRLCSREQATCHRGHRRFSRSCHMSLWILRTSPMWPDMEVSAGHIELWRKWPPFGRQDIQMHFSGWK